MILTPNKDLSRRNEWVYCDSGQTREPTFTVNETNPLLKETIETGEEDHFFKGIQLNIDRDTLGVVNETTCTGLDPPWPESVCESTIA